MRRKQLLKQAEQNRIEEEDDDLFKTEHERELGRVQQKNFKKMGNNRQNRQQQEEEDNDDMDSIEQEGQNDDEFNKLVNVHKLILKQKITKQNAFEVDVGKVQLSKYSWVNSSNFLKNLSEIHGFKIDNVHQESYRLLGLINRLEENLNEDENLEGQQQRKQQKNLQEISVEELLKKANKFKTQGNFGEKTIENRADVIDVVKYDLEFDLDPLLKQTLSQFDDSSNRGLFLTNTHLNKNIILQLESNIENTQEEQDQKNKEIERKMSQDQDLNSQQNSAVKKKNTFKPSVYSKFVQRDQGKMKFDHALLCPKLMDFKDKVEKDSKILKMTYNLTDSEYFSIQKKQTQIDIKNEDQQEQQPYDNTYADGLMNELDMLMEEGEKEEDDEEVEEVKEPEQYQPLIQEEDGQQQTQEDQEAEQDKDQEEQQPDIIDEDEDSADIRLRKRKEQELQEEQDNMNIDIFDIEEAQQRLKDIGKGRLDSKMKKILHINDQELRESKRRKKKNQLQQLEEQQKNQEQQQSKEFRIDFENIEEDEERELCFGITAQIKEKSKKERQLRKKNLHQEKIKHVFLNEIQYRIEGSQNNLLTLSKAQDIINNQEQEVAANNNEDFENFEDFDIQNEEQDQENNEQEMENEEDEEFFAAHATSEKSQVKIRDLKKKVWQDLKGRFEHQKKKQMKKKKSKESLPQSVNFQQVLEDIPTIMGTVSKKISLQSSFITILHLCNENILKLDADGFEESDFLIEQHIPNKEEQAHLIQKQQIQQQNQEQQNGEEKQQEVNNLEQQNNMETLIEQ